MEPETTPPRRDWARVVFYFVAACYFTSCLLPRAIELGAGLGDIWDAIWVLVDYILIRHFARRLYLTWHNKNSFYE